MEEIEKLYDVGDLRSIDVLTKLNEVIERVNELSKQQTK